MTTSNIVRFPRAREDEARFAASPQERTGSKEKQFIDAMTTEVISTALLVAVTTGLLTSRINSGKSIPFDVALRFLPPNPTIFPAARCMPREDLGGSLLDRCAEYYDYLQAAKSTLLRLRQDHGAGRKVCFSAKEELADLWQAACSAGLLALYEIDRLQESWPVPGAAEQFNLICEALIAARDGKSPYLEQGIPNLPEWAERRQAKRFVINAAAVLSCHGRKSTVMVTNVSRQGFGLDLASGLKVGDFISIDISGRRFVATVMWQQGKRAGVSLRKPLSALDPLLSS